MALKKFRFFVGACGPTMMYSNIIRAEDELTATKIYLTELGQVLSEENIAQKIQLIREIIPKENPERLVDFAENEISLGDNVVFIKNTYGKPPRILTGSVEKLTPKSVVIKTDSDESIRLLLPPDEDEMLPRVMITGPRPVRTVDGAVDATGYPIQVGDPVAYMGDVYAGSCDGFRTGTVVKMTAKTVEVDGTRKNYDRVVVINW